MPTLDSKVAQQYVGRIRNLVFEGGGVWGIAYEGALLELEQLGIMAHVKRVGGASAGAITAAMLAVGYTPAELGQVLRATNFKSFMDDQLGYARDTARLLTEFGWYQGDAFKEWMRQRIAKKTAEISARAGVDAPGNKPRLGELAEWRAALAKKGVLLPEPYLIGSNLSQQRREVYSAENTPQLRLEEAVRRSMSIPLFFACARGAEHDNRRDVIVDGGLTWNYPLNLFDDPQFLHDEDNGVATVYAQSEDHIFNTETLGFRVDTTKELAANLKDWSNEPAKVDNIVSYAWALVTFIRAIANKVHLHQNDWARTIFIDVGEEIGFTDFDLSAKQQQFLSDQGRKGVRNYFDWLTSAKGQKEVEAILASIRA
jgi:NTE family protein